MNKIKIALAAAIIMAFTLSLLFWKEHGQAKRLEADVSRLSVELSHAQIPLEPSVIRDSIPVVTQTVVEVPRKDLTDAMSAEKELIRDLQLRMKQLEAVQTQVVTIRDTVQARYEERDSVYCYHDEWVDLSLQLNDSTFYYNIRDSLSTIVYRDYKHHFLWWRWGTKGYRLKIVNFNPHARVIYNKYIKAGK